MSWFDKPRNCRFCGQYMSQELLNEKKKIKGQRIRENRESHGAVRKFNYDEIRIKKAESKMSIRALAKYFGCSVSPIVDAIKESK